MAYSSGTLTGSDTFTTLHGLLKAFAIADGWTVTSGTYPNLNLNQGSCFASLLFQTTDTIGDLYGSTTNASSPDYRIYGRLASNSSGTDQLSSYVVSNDFTPTYAKYWLFSGGSGDPKYITMVVQKSTGRYTVFHFGNLDKKDATYSDGAFMHGVFWDWGFSNSSTTIPSTGSNDGSDIRSSNHWWFGRESSTNTNNSQIYTNTLFSGAKVVATGELMGGMDLSLVNTGRPAAGFLGHIFFLGPMPINNTTPLFEAPVFRAAGGTPQRQYFLGTLPGFRLCSMIGRLESETLTYGTDSWIIFPFKRFLSWNPEPFLAKVPTSGPYGYAMKVNN